MPRRILAVVTAVALVVLPACAGNSSPDRGGRDADRPRPAVSVRVGPSATDEQLVGLVFAPAAVTVRAGATVEWTFDGADRHTVSYEPGAGEPPGPEVREQLIEPIGPTGGRFDPAARVSSGTRSRGLQAGRPFRLTFPTEGEYRFFCALHPDMQGMVDVTSTAPLADSRSAVAQRGAAEAKAALTAAAQVRAALNEPATPRTGDDGTPTWTIEMGASAGSADVLAFGPATVVVGLGDRITFVNRSASVHTASFGSALVPDDPESARAQQPSPGPSPQPLIPEFYLSTGRLPPGAAAPEPASFTFLPSEPGVFPFVCLIHRTSGMTGTVEVRG